MYYDNDNEIDIVVNAIATQGPCKYVGRINAKSFTLAKATASCMGYKYLLIEEVFYNKDSWHETGRVKSHYKKTEKGWICTDNNVAANPKCPLLKFMDMR